MVVECWAICYSCCGLVKGIYCSGTMVTDVTEGAIRKIQGVPSNFHHQFFCAPYEVQSLTVLARDECYVRVVSKPFLAIFTIIWPSRH